MLQDTLIGKLIIEALENGYLLKYKNTNILEKGYKSNIDNVYATMLYRSSRLFSPRDLLDKYYVRSKLTLANILQMTGIKDFNSFKKNTSFNKESLCLLTLAFNLTYMEASELLLACSVHIDSQNSIHDCVYITCLKNQDRGLPTETKIKEFNEYKVEAEAYVRSRMM